VADFFCMLALFCQKFTFTLLGDVNPTLDPFLDAEVTRLGAIDRGAEVGGQELRGCRCGADVARAWRRESHLGAIGRGADVARAGAT